MPTFLVGLSGELSVKARATRHQFIKTLWSNLETRARALSMKPILKERGMRYILQGPRELTHLLATHPGISWYSPALVGGKEDLSWLSRIEEVLPPHPFTYFVFMEKVEDSQDVELSREVKNRLLNILEKARRNRNPEDYNHPVPHLEVRGEVRDRIYLYWEKKRGMGGLPTGTAPPTLGLLSGGPDSLLAILLITKRGSLPRGIHFHYGHHQEKLIEAQARALAWFLPEMAFTLYWVEYQPLLEILKAKGPRRHLCLLCKTLMFMIASRLAREKGMEALVTGEILGEQASQTLPALAFTSRTAEVPLLRPLLGFNKEEVFARLKEWNLYDLATRGPSPCPYVPSHPVTRPRLRRDYQALLDELAPLAKVVEKTYRPGTRVPPWTLSTPPGP